MKFRHFLFSALASLALCAACEDINEGSENLDLTKLKLSEEELAFEATVSSQTFTITSGKDWAISMSEGVDWIAVDPATGKASSEPQTVTVTVTQNGGYERVEYITISTGLLEESLKITQKGELAKNYTTISAVRESMPAVANETVTLGKDILVKGTVVSNKDLDNFNSSKICYIQDETGGLQLYFSANHEFKFGDVLEVDLSEASLMNYAGAAEIAGLALDKAKKISQEKEVTPKVVKLDDFLANKYEGQYVELDALVQVEEGDLEKTWVVGGAHTNINFVNAEGKSFVVRCSKYSAFGEETVPSGSGKIRGISTIYNTTIQLVFAQESDYAGLTDERFEREVIQASTEGIVVATSARAMLVKTDDGYDYVYVGSEPEAEVGDKVKVNGEADEYAGLPQISNPEIEVISSGNEVERPAVDSLSVAEFDEYDTPFGYVKFTGTFAKSGNYYNITVPGATRKGSISYPVSVPSEFEDKNVDITGYFVGVSGTVYFNILMTDIKLSAKQPDPVVKPEIPEDATVLILDASEKLCEDFPDVTAGETTAKTYTIDGNSWTFSPSEGFKFTWYPSDKYVLWGKKGGYILMPAIAEKKLTQVWILTGKNASVSVNVGVYDAEGNAAVEGGTAMVLNKKNSEFFWVLSDTQVNTAYQLRITSAHNAQFQKVTCVYE